MNGFSTVHPDRGSSQVPHESVTTGLNYDLGNYPESGWIICRKCGYKLNKFRHPKGWETGHRQASTQLNGAITAGGTTATVDSTTGFTTPSTGTITAFADYGGFATKVTDAAHGLKGGVITIASTTNYNGTYEVLQDELLTNSFVIGKKFVSDDATGGWTKLEYIYIFDAGSYATSEDVSSAYTAATSGPRVDKISYTAIGSTTTFTGCKSISRSSGMNAHDDNMYVRSENIAKSGCPNCSTFFYE